MMFPHRADLYIVPFEDKEIYEEQISKCDFWKTTDFQGFDISCLYERAVEEKFNQPVLDTYDAKKNLSAPLPRMYDFEKCTLDEIKHIKWEFEHTMSRTAILNGYCLYFEAHFRKGKTNEYISLKTGPEQPATHW